MYIKQISITNFGKFLDQKFDLQPRLNLFLGMNEAGKSTLVAFIQQVLFGFVKANDAKNYEINQAKTFGGELTFIDDNDEFVVSRFQIPGKKSGELKVYQNGQEIDPADFFGRLKNIQPDFFADNFLFDEDTLNNIHAIGGANLAQQINVLGASNSAELTQLSQQFKKDSEELYKPSATAKKIINQELKHLDSLVQKAADNQEKFEAYQQNQVQIDELTKKSQALEDQLQEKRQALNKLNQRVANLENFQNYQVLAEKNKELISFNQADFDTVLSLNNQIDLLNQQINNNQQLLAQSETSGSDQGQLNQLLEQWSDIKNDYGQINELTRQSDAKNQLLTQNLTIQPEIEYLATLSQTDLQKMKQEFDAANQTEPSDEPQSNSRGIIIAIVAILLGVIAFFLNQSVISIVAIVIGVVALGLGWWTNENVKKRQEASKNVKENQKTSFSDKYHFNFPTEITGTLNAVMQFQAQEKELDQINQQIESLTQNVKNYLEQLNQKLSTNLSMSDFDQVQKTINYQKQLAQETRDKKSQQQTLQQNIQNDQNQMKVVQQKSWEIYQKNNVADFNQFNDQKQKFDQQQRELAQLKSLENFLGEDLTALKTGKIDGDQLNQEVKEQNAIFEKSSAELKNYESSLAELKSTQRNLVSDDEYFKLNQEIANQKTLILDAIDQFLVNKLNSQWLDEMMNLASQNRFPKMQKLAQEYFELLTNGRYDQIEFDQKQVFVKAKDTTKKLKVNQLSRGTAQQLYFSLKLSFVALIADEINLPIIIDDAFVNFDSSRIQNIEQLLEKLSQDHQVIILTQRPELAEIFNQDSVILLGEENAKEA